MTKYIRLSDDTTYVRYFLPENRYFILQESMPDSIPVAKFQDVKLEQVNKYWRKIYVQELDTVFYSKIKGKKIDV